MALSTRGKELVGEYTIEELCDYTEKLEGQKDELETEVDKLKDQIQMLNEELGR